MSKITNAKIEVLLTEIRVLSSLTVPPFLTETDDVLLSIICSKQEEIYKLRLKQNKQKNTLANQT